MNGLIRSSQKTLVALAALASISAFAQSSVTISGNIDLGYRSLTEKGSSTALNADDAAADATTRKQTGPVGNGAEGWTSSALKLTVSEDVGGGMTAGYVGEMNVSSFGAGADSANQLLGSGRQSFVSIGSATGGTLSAGYQYTLQDQIQGGVGRATPTGNVGGRIQNFSFNTDPNRAALASGKVAREGYEVVSSGAITRANSFQYASPVMSGFQALVQYASQFDDKDQVDATKAGKATGKLTAFGGKYSNGPLNLGLAYQEIVSDATTYGTALTKDQKVTTKDTTIAANYDFGMAKVFVNNFTRNSTFAAGSAFNGSIDTNAYGLFKDGGSLKRTGTDLGTSVPMGKTTLFAAYGTGKYKMDADGTGAGDASIKARLIGATYDFSKRTSLNAYYAFTKGTYDGQVNELSRKNMGVGLRHQF